MNRAKVLILILTLAFAFWFIPFVPAFLIGTINQTRYIYSTSTSIQKLVGPGHNGWTPISSVSKNVVAAFICAEDANFYQHSGLDLEAIKKSWIHNQKKKKIRGGSTITQQVVKVGLLSYERSYIRKIREAIGAVILEKLITKDEILEWYLNMVEFGDGIYGIHQASQSYFKTKPEKLTIAQAINLALVLPAPNKWSKGLKNKSLTVFNQKRFKFILRQMLLGGYITKGQWEQTMASGNFGRPIIGFSEEFNKINKEDPSELDPINELEESDLDQTSNRIQENPEAKDRTLEVNEDTKNSKSDSDQAEPDKITGNQKKSDLTEIIRPKDGESTLPEENHSLPGSTEDNQDSNHPP